MTQVSLQVTGTRSTYVLTGGGVTLTVTFFSPVDPANLQRQCVPFGYVTIRAASADGRAHAVDLHFDTSAEWVHGDTSTPVTWTQQQSTGYTLLSCTPASPGVLQENGEQASWGSLVLAAPTSGVSWQIGQDTVVRAASAGQGALANTSDTAQPRAISDRWPVLAFNKNLGTIPAGGSSSPFTLSIGHVRTPAVRYLGTPLNPWWTHYWGSWQDMAVWFANDYASALGAAVAIDQRLHDDAVAAAGGGTTGEHYAAICALALRQAFGGTELVDRGGAPWGFLKEISSSGNMSTVDVTYPAFPAYLVPVPGLPAADPGAAAGLRRARRLADAVRRARHRHPLPGRGRAQRRQRGEHAGRGVGQHADHGRRAGPAAPVGRRPSPSRPPTTRSCGSGPST